VTLKGRIDRLSEAVQSEELAVIVTGKGYPAAIVILAKI
jgi:PHD/YefM family antitoxin component YafN of YafNO toxin-antitoxin module